MLNSFASTRWLSGAATALLLLSLSAAASARHSPAYDRGDTAYKSGNYTTAAQEFLQAAKDDPTDAVAFWRLGWSRRKLGDYQGTQAAWESARAADPSLKFTTQGKFESALSDVMKVSGKKGKSRRRTGTFTLPGANRAADPVVTALLKSDAYVEPSMSGLADEMKLESLARSYRPRVVKIAVLESGPTPNRDQYAQYMHTYLGLHNGLLILATRRGVAAYTPALDRNRLNQIVKDSRVQFAGSYYDGIKYVGDNVLGTVARRSGNSRLGWLVAIIAAVGGFLFLRNRKRAADKKRIDALNHDIGHRMEALQDEFKRFDLEAASVKDTPLLQEAKQLRLAAVDPFAAAGEALNVAATIEEYEKADALTTQAEKLAARARIRLEQAQGKRSMDDPGGEASIPRSEDVPVGERGACFFCSKPARLEQLHPLPVNMNGQTQRVLACDDCYQVAKTGRNPQVLTVPDDGGQRIPWYQSQRYDPWNDYGRFGSSWGGGGGFGLMDYLLLDNLLDNNRRSNNTTIYVQDPGYAETYAQNAGGAGFSHDTWMQPDRGEGDFFGTGADNSPANAGGQEHGVGDFFSSDSS